MRQARVKQLPALAELRAERIWTAWRIEKRLSKKTGKLEPTKRPYYAINRGASHSNPATWRTYDQIVALVAKHDGHFNGIGFFFGDTRERWGADFDKVLDPTTGAFRVPEAETLVKALDSYSEITPSKGGIHVVGRGGEALPPDLKGGTNKTYQTADGHTWKIELYNQLRFFTYTGDHLSDTPTSIEPRPTEANALYTHLKREPDKQTAEAKENDAGASRADDRAVLAQALAARRGDDFYRLYFLRDTSGYKNDASSADSALACFLAIWTQDPEQIERLMRHSALKRPKWDQHKTYLRQLVIERALTLTEKTHKVGTTKETAPLILRTLSEIIADGTFANGPEVVVANFAWRGRISLISGEEKSGKTTLAASHAASVSKKGETVLWLALEGNIDDLAFHLVHHFGCDPSRIILVDRLPNGLDSLAEAITRTHPTLVVVDSLSALAEGIVEDFKGGSEEWTKFLNRLGRIVRDADTACELIHHVRKSDGKYRDSTAIGAGVDAILTMSEKEGARSTVRFFKRPRARWTLEPFAVRFEEKEEQGASRYVLAPLEEELSAQDKVLSYIEAHAGCSRTDIREATKVHSRTLTPLLSRLEHEGAIVVDRPSGKTGGAFGYTRIM